MKYITQIVIEINDQKKWRFVNETSPFHKNIKQSGWPTNPGVYVSFVPCGDTCGKPHLTMTSMEFQIKPEKVTLEQGKNISRRWSSLTKSEAERVSALEYENLLKGQLDYIKRIIHPEPDLIEY